VGKHVAKVAPVLVTKRTNVRSDCDKSSEEDTDMRLYEFINPKDYVLPVTKAADPPKQIKKTDELEAAEARSKKKIDRQITV
jgi:hypothetical protein